MDESATVGPIDEQDTLAGEDRPRPAADDELPLGSLIGRYVIVSRIGAGAMGVVYAAYDPELDRKVAVKLLRADRLEGEKGAESRARIVREAQAMAKVTHPNVATVHDVGTFGDAVFIAMEFIDGSTLTQWLEQPHPRKEILDVFVAAGHGLSAAHEAGLVHRDFKPDNVMIGRDGRPRVMDFGLARSSVATDEPPAPLEAPGETMASALSLSGEQLTQTGALMGTPAYMAPEQHLGGLIDQRSDQFSYCVALYEAVCGQRPFRGANLASLAFQVASGKVAEPPREIKLARWLRRVLWRGLSPKPEQRFPDMKSLLADLEHDRTAARRVLPWVGLAVVGLGIGGFALASGPELDPCGGAREHVAGVWDVGRREQVREALAATGVGFADETFDRVAERTDVYVAEWERTYEQACVAHQRGEATGTLLDRQMACLEQRLLGVGALVDVLIDADADLVPRAVEATARLSPISLCRDVDALLAAVPPPEDPMVVARLAEVDPQMARIDALDRAGRYPEALALAIAVVPEVEAIGYRPLIARARAAVGGLQGELGELDAAEQMLMRAFWDAIVARDDHTATNAASALASLYADELGRPDEALQWAEHAGAFAEREGAKPSAEALMRLARGNAYFAKGDLERAHEEYERGLEATRLENGEDHPSVAASLNNLGNVYEAMNELEAAKRLHEESLAIKERVLGPSHPDVAFSLYNLANLAFRESDMQTARDYHLRALAIRENATGKNSAETANSLSALGVVYDELGDDERANEVLERALSILEQEQGEGTPAVGVALTNLADLDLQAQRYDRARTRYDRALGIFERSFGADHVNTSYPLAGLGVALIELDRPDEAIPLLERALALRQGEGPIEYERAETRLALARALWEAGGDRRRARTLGEQAAGVDVSQGAKHGELREQAQRWLATHVAASAK